MGNKKIILFSVIAGLLLGVFCYIHSAQAATLGLPSYLSYQGRLKSSAGAALTGTYDFTFKLYDAVTGGTLLWTEAETLTVTSGYFSTTLGDDTAFGTSVDFTNNLWLEISVAATGVTPQETMTTRAAVNSVAFALAARGIENASSAPSTVYGGRVYYNTANGNLYVYDAINTTWSTLYRTGGTDVALTDGGTGASDAATARTNLGVGTSSSPAFTGLTLSGLTAGSVPFAGTSGLISQDNANLYWDDTNNRLGIGTASPSAILDVNGSIQTGVEEGLVFPTLGTAFAMHTSSNTYESVRDDVLVWGYNIQSGTMNTRLNASEPQLRFLIEANYRTVGGDNIMEWNMDYTSADGLTARRPLYFTLDRSTHASQLTLAIDAFQIKNSAATSNLLTMDSSGNLTVVSSSDIRPTEDGTNAINIANAAGTDFVSFDTTNARVGIGTTSPGAKFELVGGGMLLSETFSGTTPVGLDIQPVFDPDADSAGYGIYMAYPDWGAGSKNIGSIYGINISGSTWDKTTSGTITNAYSAYIDAPTIASNNYSLYVANGTTVLGATSGSVGIGAVAPASLLEISDVDAAPVFTITSLNNDGGLDPTIKFRTGATPAVRWTVGVDDSSSDSLKFEYADGLGGASPAMSITSAGYVGIGEQSPSVALEVNGNVNLDNDQFTNLAGGLNPGYYVYKSGTTSYGMKIQFTSPEVGTMIFGPNAANTFISFGKVGTALEDDDMVEYMKLDLDNGNLAMGSATVDTGALTMIKGAQTGDPQVQFALSADANGDFSITADTGDITLAATDDIYLTPTGGTIYVAGDIDNNGNSYDWDLNDNSTSALSFDASGKAGILNIVTTDSAEGVTMSGYLTATGTITGGTLTDGAFTANSGAVSGVTTLGMSGNFTMSGNTVGITHSGTTSLAIISTSGTVAVESVTFTGANVSGMGTLGLTGDITISGDTANITHSGTTSLTIASTSGTVGIESVVFTGGAISSATSIAMGGALSGVTDLTMAGEFIDYVAVNDDNPFWALGSSAAERLAIQANYSAGTQTVANITFTTATASATADMGQYIFNVDGTNILIIDDGGMELTGGLSVTTAFLTPATTDMVFSPAGTEMLRLNYDAGAAVAGVALTASGSDDIGFSFAQTLNDTEAEGGTQVYTMIKGVLTETSKTGWDTVNLMDLKVGATSKMTVTDAGGLTLGGGLTLTDGGISMSSSGYSIIFSDADNIGYIFGGSTQTLDHPIIAVGANTRAWMLADAITDFGLTQQTNPTFVIQSADQTKTYEGALYTYSGIAQRAIGVAAVAGGNYTISGQSGGTSGDNVGGLVVLYGGAGGNAGADGYVKIGQGAGTPTLTMTDDDLYVLGQFEVDNNARFDLPAAGKVFIDAATTDNNGTAGVIDIDHDSTASSQGISIDSEVIDDNAIDTQAGILITMTNSANDSDVVYGLQVAELGGAASGGNEYAIYQAGTGWDYGLYVTDASYFSGASTFIGALTHAPTATGTLLDYQLETEWTTGTLINADFGSATTFSGAVSGFALDFQTNVTALNIGSTGITGGIVKLPAVTNTGDSPYSMQGFNVLGGDISHTTAAGETNWTGYNVIMPNQSETAPANVAAYGFRVTGGTVTSGDAYGVYVAMNAMTDAAINITKGALLFAPTTTGTLIDFDLDTEWQSGSLLTALFSNPTTQTGDYFGMVLNFNSNLAGVADQDVIGYQMSTPALTQSTSATTNYIGWQLLTAGALVQDTLAGTINWKGVDINMPNTTQTTGAVNAYGINITGGTITSGTVAGVNVAMNAMTDSAIKITKGALLFAPTTTGALIDFDLDTEWTTGTLFNAQFSNATTLTSPIVGVDLSFNTNVNATNQNVTGYIVELPAVTNTGASTYSYKGVEISGGNIDNTNAGGSTEWNGILITMPAITQTAGGTIAAGLEIAGGTVTSGTANGLYIDMDAVDDYAIYIKKGVFYIDAATIDAVGNAIDIDYDTATAEVSAISVNTRLTADVDIAGITSGITGFDSGHTADGEIYAYDATLAGDNNDTAVTYIAYNTNANKNSGTSTMTGMQIGVNYDKAINAMSGTVTFAGLGTADAVNLQINASTGLLTKPTSSLRYKTDIQDLPLNVDQIMAFRPVSFKLNEKTADPGFLGYGLIAEEVEQINKDLVYYNKEGQVDGVYYDKVYAMMLKMLQEQQAQIQSLSVGNNLQGNLNGNIIADSLTVSKHVAFNGDTIGQARILAGITEVKVQFEKEYEYQPVVALTARGENILTTNFKYTVIDESTTGFTIKISEAQNEPIEFNWQAFGSYKGKIFISDGSTEDIKIVLAKEAVCNVGHLQNCNTVEKCQKIENYFWDGVCHVNVSSPANSNPLTNEELPAQTSNIESVSNEIAPDSVSEIPAVTDTSVPVDITLPTIAVDVPSSTTEPSAASGTSTTTDSTTPTTDASSTTSTDTVVSTDTSISTDTATSTNVSTPSETPSTSETTTPLEITSPDVTP